MTTDARRVVGMTTADGRPVRVAHVTTVDMSLALLLSTELAVDVGAGLEVLGVSAPGPYLPRIEAIGVRHVPVPSFSREWRPGSDARAAGELVAALRRLRPDVVHTHTPKAGVVGRLTARALRVPVVVNTCHGLWLRDGDPLAKRTAVLSVESVAALSSHAELYQNAEDRVRLRRVVRGARGEVVGNGVDLDRFRPRPDVREAVRARLGVRPGEPLVGAVGRVVDEKGVDDLRSAVRLMRGGATVVWVGPPPPGETLPPDEPRLRFVGELDDMPSLYAALDVFVLPSHREGFSRSAMEAAACGLPMVLTDIRGCREIGLHGEDLLLVPPREPRTLAAAVDRLLADPGLRQRLAAGARRQAVTRFDQVEVAQRSLRAYAAVAARRGLGWRVVTR